MLTKRIIPCLGVDGGHVIKGVKFMSHRDAGDPVELAAMFVARGRRRRVRLYGPRVAKSERPA